MPGIFLNIIGTYLVTAVVEIVKQLTQNIVYLPIWVIWAAECRLKILMEKLKFLLKY